MLMLDKTQVNRVDVDISQDDTTSKWLRWDWKQKGSGAKQKVL